MKVLKKINLIAGGICILVLIWIGIALPSLKIVYDNKTPVGALIEKIQFQEQWISVLAYILIYVSASSLILFFVNAFMLSKSFAKKTDCLKKNNKNKA